MKLYYAYSFLAGLFMGGYTNLFSKVIISGLVIYIVHPENFSPKRFAPLYTGIYDTLQPYISKIYILDDSGLIKSSLPPLSPLNIQENTTLKLKIK